jgi:AcrR family transcriptional regulator
MTNMSARGSYAVGRKRRTEIVETATELFEERGYYQTSMVGIAATIGLSDGGLAHHFATKKHLLLAVAQHRLDTDADWWARLPEDVLGFAVFDQMIEATRLHVEKPGQIELFVIVSAEAADTSSPAHELFKNRYERAIANLADRLRRGLEPQGYVLDYAQIARDCVAISDGLQLQWVITDGAIDLVGEVRAHVERLRRAIQIDTPAPAARS